MEKNTKIITIVVGLIVAIAAIAGIVYWNKGVQQTSAYENEPMTSENTVYDSSTGQVAYLPTSDPETTPSNSGSRPTSSHKTDTVYDSRTGEEVPMPTSDPGY